MNDAVISEKPLWTGQDMADAMSARPVRDLPSRVEGISIDSRTLKPGEAFFAIEGDRVDGHKFATAAAGNGASVLVVAEEKLASMGRLTVPLLVVSDVLEALRSLGMAARARTKARIVAITGSAGKTTTKDALAYVLSKQGATHASAASFNNHWGVPLTLARMPEHTRFGVFEIGMNHHSEITPLVKMVRPHVSMVTLIAAAHLGHFKDLDDIAKAKAEIFVGLEDNGTALINADDVRFGLLSKLAAKYGVENISGYGEAKTAPVRLTSFALLSDCSTIKAKVFDEEVAAKVGVPGRHVVQNIVGALGAASLLGADVQKAALALDTLSASPGRGQHFKLTIGGGEATLIDESYNANPASMQAALQTMANMKLADGGRRVAILGDMRELGDHSVKEHAGLAQFVLDNGVDEVFLAGPEMAALRDELADKVAVTHHEKTDDLGKALDGQLRAADIITVKSSNGTGLSKIVAKLRETYGTAVE
ncbi:MAG: UDP-N-acetylmuramoylalanyl-D-glutamyl-2,6-diaminopimelate--D-alanyl-D-alanine ligase [Pseudomonadota bacterium]